jgi:hypothetical protein
MLYAPDFEQNAIDREQSAYDAMVAWLSIEPAETWLWFAQHGNWDTCVPVFLWMVEQPECDAAVLASLFWEARPANLAERVAAGEARPAEWEADELVQLILLTWRGRVPRNAGLEPAKTRFDKAYRAFVSSQPGGVDPLAVPEWLFGPFGTADHEDLGHRVASDDHLRGVFLELGMHFGDAPPVAVKTQGPDTPADMTPAERRMQITIGLALMTPMILLICSNMWKWLSL